VVIAGYSVQHRDGVVDARNLLSNGSSNRYKGVDIALRAGYQGR
jgi:hypothetical protein